MGQSLREEDFEDFEDFLGYRITKEDVQALRLIRLTAVGIVVGVACITFYLF